MITQTKYLKIYLIFIVILIIINLISASQSIENNTIGNEIMLLGYSQKAQSFTIGNMSENTYYELDKLSIKGYGFGTCKTNISIRSSLNGDDLSINKSFNLSGTGWFNITMPKIYLFKSRTYYIIFDLGCKNIYIYYGNDYNGGKFFYGESGDWGIYENEDILFEVYATKVSENISTIILDEPKDNKITYNKDIYFIGTFLDILNLTNSTIFIWNLTDLLYSKTKEISEQTNISYNNFTLLNYGIYNWNYKICNSIGNCSLKENNNTLNYVNYSIGCIKKTCEDIANYKYHYENCGNWSDGCGGELQCGICSDSKYLNNHVYISGCTCTEHQSCDNMTINHIYSTILPFLQNSYDDVIDYFGGYEYIKNRNYPFPDANVTMDCKYWNQYDTPLNVNVDSGDPYGQRHEFIHWLIRKQSEPTSNFYYTFEEGFTNRITHCMMNKNDACCNIDNSICNYTIIPDSYWCHPGQCNYQGDQAGMIGMTSSRLNCDIEHCWRWFFKNKISNKNGDILDILDVYSYLVSYTNNKSAVDYVMNKYLINLGIDINDYNPIIYDIPNEAYPSSMQPSDKENPIIIQNTPIDLYITNESTVFFNCSATDNIKLLNISLYTNITGDFILNQSINISGISNISYFNISKELNGTYLWNCKACDNSSNCIYGNNKTFEIRIESSPEYLYPIFYDYHDNNASLINTGLGLFNISINNSNGTVFFYINNILMNTTNISNVYYANYSFTNYGEYTYYWFSYGIGNEYFLGNSEPYYYTVNKSSVNLFNTESIEWNNETEDIFGIELDNLTSLGQSFTIGTKTINKDYNLTNISIYIKNSLPYYGKIWIELINISNYSQILSYSNNISTTNISTDYSWLNFDMNNYRLKSDNKYIINIKTDVYYSAVKIGFTDNKYSQGDLYYSQIAYDDSDLLFVINGNGIDNTTIYDDLLRKIEWNNETTIGSTTFKDETSLGQSFTIGTNGENNNYNLTSIKLKLQGLNTKCNITTMIVDTTFTNILSTNNSLSVETDVNGEIFNIILTPTILNKDMEYLIIINATCNNSGSAGIFLNQNSYSGGELYGGFFGEWFKLGGNYDFYFELYGYNINSSCIPNCTCNKFTCLDETCSNGCGGICQGTLSCGADETIKNDTYPTFSYYYDNSPINISNNEEPELRVNVNNTNGTVILNINNENITVGNVSNIYNSTYNFTENGTYKYKWFSFGNDIYNTFGISQENEFIVNGDCIPDCTGKCGGEDDSCGGTCNDLCICSTTTIVGLNIIMIIASLLIPFAMYIYAKNKEYNLSYNDIVLIFVSIIISVSLWLSSGQFVGSICGTIG